MLNSKQKADIEESFSSSRDRDFFARVYSKDQSFYVAKLKGLKLENLGKVLDAGSGFGQWSFALGQLNDFVAGIDIEKDRIHISRMMAKNNRIGNVDFLTATLESIPFAVDSFDAIFSFSVVYFTDYRRSFSEFHRVLKPGGKVYICTNSWGWYLYNFVRNHNPSSDFRPRAYALETYFHTLKFKITGKSTFGKSLIMSPKTSRAGLSKVGFKDIVELPAEGNEQGLVKPLQIYPKHFLGVTSVYELIADK